MFTTTLRRDVPAQFFAACAVLTLTVSIPATFALLRPFHDAGGWIGVAFAVFAMLVLEIGAVGAKLISVVIPRWWWHLTALTVALLVLTTLGNYLHGVELFRAAELPPTLAAIRNDKLGAWLAPLLAAALFPLLLFVWLTALTERLKALTAYEQVMSRREQELEHREQALDNRLATSEQVMSNRTRELARREQALIEREQAPAQIEQVEVIEVATYRLTWRQFEQVASKAVASKSASLSSLRRLVASVAEDV
jgi:hypothetical protein